MINLLELSTDITSRFGKRDDPFTGKPNADHTGIDLVLKDPNIPAVLGGKVLKATRDGQRGNYVMVEQTDGTVATYMHLASISVRAGTTIEEGQKIGVMGSTGNSTGRHLHYEVKKGDSYLDPQTYFNQNALGNENYVSDSEVEIINNSGSASGYSVLGNILRFIVLLLVAVAAAYLVLKAFDIEIM